MKEFCADLEIAKELKEKGFPQECMFRYCCFDQSEKNLVIKYINESNFGLQYITDAPTSDELLKELPKVISDLNFDYYYHLKIEKSPIHDEFYFISYGITNQEHAWMEQYHANDKKLSNALAKMWLYLKKENLL